MPAEARASAVFLLREEFEVEKEMVGSYGLVNEAPDEDSSDQISGGKRMT